MDFEIVAHRGYSAIAPENTRAAFAAAVAGGAGAIEFDVRLSADGIPILIHDPTVERTTDGTGNVSDLTLEQLKGLDAGMWFSDRFIGERIPTFGETLDFLDETPLKAYAEIKDGDDWSDEDIQRLIATLDVPHWRDRLAIASFSDDFLGRVKACNTAIPLAYYPLTASEYLEQLRRLKPEENAILLCEYHLLLENPQLVAAGRDRNIDVGAWTVDNPQDMGQLIRLGVKQIVTNSLLER
ncbi:MAG: glycerophosphodiester phosphodiesterase family protein [Cyanobacteriota bacterium]|nr:glycerophosphodiester phosphodiesterase family protein [Cyanobacteriota bacterium]